MSEYKIAAALIKASKNPVKTADIPTEQFFETINRNAHEPNLLADYVFEHNLNRQRALFVRLEATDQAGFPRIDRTT